MSRLKRKKQIRFLPLLLSLQLFIPSQVLATDTNQFQQWKETAQTLQVLQGAADQMVQMHQQRMQQQQAQQMKMSLQRDLALQPVDPSQVPPILSQNGCMVLPARSNRTSGGISCDPPYDPGKLQSGIYDALLEVAEANHNTVSNFLTEGHQRFSTQGLGCYEKAQNKLEQQLQVRLDRLNQMEESLKRRTETLAKNLRKDLLEIKKGDALLNGGSKDKEVQAALKNYRFEDQFKDPACRSYFNDANIKTMAKDGFRGIEQALGEKTSSINPTAFLSKSSQLEKEIKDLGSHVGRKHKNADGLGVQPQNLLSGFTPRILNTDSKAIARVLNNTNDEIQEENKQVIRELTAVIPRGDQSFKALLEDTKAGIEQGTIDLGFRLSEFEKEAKNKCLSSYVQSNFGGVEGFTKKLQDPNVSQKANEEADSSFKNYIESILTDNRMTIETKKKKIQEAQSKGANRNIAMVTGKSITVEGKNISASTRMPASKMVDMFVDNCVARFDSEPDPTTGKSPRDVVNAIKKYNNEFKKMKTKLTSKLQSNLVNELLRCPSDENTGKAAMSCDEKSIQTGSQNFCLRTAKSCASNLNGCFEKAQQKVEETRQLQAKHVKVYKGQINLFKEAIKQEFSQVAFAMEREAKTLDGLYQMGTSYNMPMGLDLQTMVSEATLMKNVDPSLGIEDPEVYFKKIQQNIGKLKQQIQEQNDEVKGKFSEELQKYASNYATEQGHWKKVATDCMARINDHNKAVQMENEKRQREFAKQQEAIANSCNRFKDFRRNPCPAGGGEVGGLSEDMAAIGNYLGDSTEIIDDVISSCQNVESYDIPNSSVANSDKYQLSLDEFCNGAGKESLNCQVYVKTKKDYEYFMVEGRMPAGQGNGDSNLQCKDISKGDISSALGTNRVICTITNGNETRDSITSKEECSGEGKKPNDLVGMSYNSASSTLKAELRELINCSEDSSVASDNSIKGRHESAREGAMEELAGYRRNKMTERMGQVQVAACDGMATGEVDMTGDPIQQMIRQMSGRAGAGSYAQ